MKLINSFLVLIIFFSCNSNGKDFKLCSGKTYPYYNPTLRYKKNFYEIKKYYYSEYKTIKLSNNNGIVKISFNINCKGETGNFHIETYSLNYKNIKINEKIIKQLLFLTKGLKSWIPASNENGINVNSHKFFAFKIINGELNDILPK